MSESQTIRCYECGRANSAMAKWCIWCGMPILDATPPHRFEKTCLEINYLGGVERLDDPMPVRLVVGPDGIDVDELMPGSRKVSIAADSIIDASVVDASAPLYDKQARSGWWRRVFSASKGPAGRKIHDYILTIRYEAGGEVRNAVFRSEASDGLSRINNLARLISLLVRNRR